MELPVSGNTPETYATSQAAATAMGSSKAATLRQQVFDAIYESVDGLTDDEIQAQLGLSGNTERPRRWELEQAGHIWQRGTRVNARNRHCAVWVARW